MSRTYYAESVKEDGLVTNLQRRFLVDGANLIFLGIWDHGTPLNPVDLGELAYQAGAADISDEMARLDMVRANKLGMRNPLICFEAFSGAREELIAARRAASILGADKGYNRAAVADAQAVPIARTFARLAELTAALGHVRAAVQAAEREAATTFPDDAESELAATMYDAAIVARVLPLVEGDLVYLRQGSMPPKLDARAVQALVRVPRAVTGLDDEAALLLRNAYASTAAPRTMALCKMLHDMIEAARLALASAVLNLAEIALLTPDEGFRRIPEGGEWLQGRLWDIGVSKQHVDDMLQRGVEAAQRRQPQRTPEGKTWTPPIG